MHDLDEVPADPIRPCEPRDAFELLVDRGDHAVWREGRDHDRRSLHEDPIPLLALAKRGVRPDALSHIPNRGDGERPATELDRAQLDVDAHLDAVPTPQRD